MGVLRELDSLAFMVHDNARQFDSLAFSEQPVRATSPLGRTAALASDAALMTGADRSGVAARRLQQSVEPSKTERLKRFKAYCQLWKNVLRADSPPTLDEFLEQDARRFAVHANRAVNPLKARAPGRPRRPWDGRKANGD
jgi:hypothetical protein